MGASKSSNKRHDEEKQIIERDAVLEDQSNPITKAEIDELYLYESATCKIRFETLIEGKKAICTGTGFFCEIDDRNIPFNKALFTNNHILNENKIKMNEQVEIEYLGKTIKIDMTKDRKTFTNKELDYTCIQILDRDSINKFLSIDKTFFKDKNSLINREIFILQYPDGILSHHSGKIIGINNNTIEHNVPTKGGSSGFPLIKRFNMDYIVGIHFGVKNKEGESYNKLKCNIATPFDIILEDIIDKLSKNVDHSKSVEYRNTINLIYNKKIEDEEDEDCNKIFGKKFV
jgi:hypothetical protein